MLWKRFKLRVGNTSYQVTVSEAMQAVNIKVEDTIETRLEESEA